MNTLCELSDPEEGTISGSWLDWAPLIFRLLPLLGAISESRHPPMIPPDHQTLVSLLDILGLLF